MDGYCFYCCNYAPKLNRDHIIPVSKGGKNSADNIVMACYLCNTHKGNRTLNDWHDKIHSHMEPSQKPINDHIYNNKSTILRKIKELTHKL